MTRGEKEEWACRAESELFSKDAVRKYKRWPEEGSGLPPRRPLEEDYSSRPILFRGFAETPRRELEARMTSRAMARIGPRSPLFHVNMFIDK